MPGWTTIELVETDRHVRTLYLNRPAQRNAVSATLAVELLDCVGGLERDDAMRVLVLAGRGPAFCAGGDLKERLEGGPDRASRQRHPLLRALDALDRLPAPVIASVHGPALAGGLEIALACDLRIAGESATFGLPEVRTAGAFAGAGGPVRLAQLVGRGRASLVSLTGRAFSAREAFELGFVEQVVPDDRLAEATRALAREIADGSPLGVRATKRLIRRAIDVDHDAAMELSRALRDPLDDTADAREGVAAWRERRAPRFGGA